MTQSLPSKSLVLYADDDPDDRMLIKEAFHNYTQSIELKTFNDGIDLLKYVEHSYEFEPLPCLVILDINMPRMNGKEVLRKIRSIQEYDEVPVILFSTSTLPSEMAFARSFDAGFLTKPLYTEQIYQLVDRMIDHCSDDVKRNIKRFGK
jgi:CheY-like chemotaxis protein